MKKSLVALAVLAATGAFAQSSVTLYGRLDLGTSSTKTTTTGFTPFVGATPLVTTVKATQLAGAQNNWTGSRLGVRGSEDLGGGLKANFAYEFRLDPDAVATPGTLFGRTRTALLQVAGGFGSVTIGTYLNPFDDIRLGAGVYGVPGSYTLDKINSGGVGLSGRSVNSIGYRSPVFAGGFTASFGTTSQSVETTTNIPANTTKASTSGYIGSVGYANGPINVLAAYGQGKLKASTTLPATSGEGKVTDFGVKASYDLGVAVPYIMYENAKTSSNANGLSNGSDNSRGFEIGSTFPMGAFTPYILFASNKVKETLPSGATGDVDKTRAFQVGTQYSLSKRTFVYGGIGRSTVKTENTTAQAKSSGYALGLVHNF